jgi:hypothetical protein
MFICNAFSLNMLPGGNVSLGIKEISLEEAVVFAAKLESAVGHADTAAVFSNLLQRPVVLARLNVSLQRGDTILVGQYNGPRLPEGATTLPEGATIRWLQVSLN